jgi:hypothetical protein
MKKVSEKKPKKGDILVLKENRNVIYEFNENNPKGNPNACNVAVHLYDSIGKDPVVNYKYSDLDCVGYNEPWEYATPDEIDKFNNAIKTYQKQRRKCDIVKVLDEFIKKHSDTGIDQIKSELINIIKEY